MKIIAANSRAKYDYLISEKIDAGIVFDTAKNEHIPRKYANRIFSMKIDFVAMLK